MVVQIIVRQKVESERFRLRYQKKTQLDRQSLIGSRKLKQIIPIEQSTARSKKTIEITK